MKSSRGIRIEGLSKRYGEGETAIIVVTHDEKIIPTFKRIYHIRDGVTHEEAGEGRSFDHPPKEHPA
ncbi:MAG: hypothetical protein IT480_18340 [Gammaproteobacteria bacterium]|nr:hypothetical protein [Gammaproteobacteria bacterium]